MEVALNDWAVWSDWMAILLTAYLGSIRDRGTALPAVCHSFGNSQ